MRGKARIAQPLAAEILIGADQRHHGGEGQLETRPEHAGRIGGDNDHPAIATLRIVSARRPNSTAPNTSRIISVERNAATLPPEMAK